MEHSGQGHYKVTGTGFIAKLKGCFPCLQPSQNALTGEATVEHSYSYSAESRPSKVGSSSAILPGFSSQTLTKSNEALLFTMDELCRATANFNISYKIGQGGFGTVYRGKLPDGTLVAIKRARKDTFEARLSNEFRSEVNMLASVEHLNLVKLIGYLEEGNERILVEEFVPNGNLRQHLDCNYGIVLDLPMRLDIAIDVAHALTYLHLYADRPIIHRDVKSSNILLTASFRAKVADFGFSRVGPSETGITHVSTQVKGTAGYLDPEYLKSYQLTQKSDVYSFGILLIELLTGRRPIELRRPTEERITVRWAFKKFLDRNIVDLLDPNLERTPELQALMEKISELAFQCSAPTKQDRPTMKKVTEHLWAIRKDSQSLKTLRRQDSFQPASSRRSV